MIAATEPPTDRELLRVMDLVVEYAAPGGQKVHAVSGVSLEVRKGETLGLVGESGCGKSSTGMAIMQLRSSKSGSVIFDGVELGRLGSHALRRTRRHLQVVFQDPTRSLNPRRTVRRIVEEGLAINGTPRPWNALVDAALVSVGLDPEVVGDRRPFELSGGQCQRVALARAVVLRPSLLVCDEPVSALDVSVQAQILNLLEDMKQQFALSMLFIAHDLAVVKSISDRVAVMYLGRVCEVAPSDALYAQPRHPYTRALMDAVPDPDPNAMIKPMLAKGDLPSPLAPPSGCRFRTRCPRAQALCADEEPSLLSAGFDHQVACHFPEPVEAP